ncbi:helix-turn-helix domain-containing protein [Rhodococcus fascians]|nr:helix-turn-helix domain-containing protein [Rhodococcus fascians]MBY4237748.1 helix-turn-helix domain-containing protein [Rhodococcus fascians]MBY4253951.1 helix-turn-helix domain-containing protein [Rhodococcus fascians]MBY4269178.1 helix-turn-helix domain-containing protein [Rhodococcus fascians]
MTVLTTWLTEQEAQHYIGRSRSTLYRWRKLGIVRARKLPNRQWQYAQSTLKLALADTLKRQAATQLQMQNRRFIHGPGRGHKRFGRMSAKMACDSGQLELFVLGG